MNEAEERNSRGGAGNAEDLDGKTLAPVHSKQVLTYLRLINQPVGLLINFGAATLKEGLHRIVNNLSPSASPRLRVNHP